MEREGEKNQGMELMVVRAKDEEKERTCDRLGKVVGGVVDIRRREND